MEVFSAKIIVLNPSIAPVLAIKHLFDQENGPYLSTNTAGYAGKVIWMHQSL
jgi:hypothetical protein